MVSLVLLTTTLNIVFLLQVNALVGQCNQNAKNYILRITNVKNGFLNQLIKYSPYTYAFANKNSSVQTSEAQGDCVIASFTRPNGCSINDKRATGISTTYLHGTYQDRHYDEYCFENPVTSEYQEIQVGRGHLNEIDKNNVVYDLLLPSVYPVLCYYRCSNSSEAENVPFVGAAVPVSLKSSRQIKAAVQKCKSRLRAAGITDTLVDLPL